MSQMAPATCSPTRPTISLDGQARQSSLGEAQGRPDEVSALMALEAQVQQLSASQSSSQQQMQLMYAAQQTVQQQMQSLLAHLQTTQPPAHPQPPLTHSPQPQTSQPTLPQGQTNPAPPTAMQPMPPMPPRPEGPSGAGMAPPLVANMTGRSLTSYFLDMRPTLLLEITKHEFDPGQLF